MEREESVTEILAEGYYRSTEAIVRRLAELAPAENTPAWIMLEGLRVACRAYELRRWGTQPAASIGPDEQEIREITEQILAGLRPK